MANSDSRNAVSGVTSDGLPMTQFPVANAGAINIVYGSNFGLLPNLAPLPDRIISQADIGAAVEPGDRFGEVLAAGDFNPSIIFNADDLIIGVPSEGVGGLDQAGAVVFVRGIVGTGISPVDSLIFSQNSGGLPFATAEPGDRFGEALAVADFDGDGADDLAIGSPGEGIAFVGNTAGVVHVLFGDALPGQLSTTDSLFITRATLEGGSVAGMRFGESLAAGFFDNDGFGDLVIGVPRETISGEADAGMVYALDGQANRSFDFAGAVRLSQEGSVPGLEEFFDHFGEVLAVGDWDDNGLDDLAVGVPSENPPSNISDVGAVNIFLSGGPVVVPVP